MSGSMLLVLGGAPAAAAPRGATLPDCNVYATYTGSPTTASFTLSSDGTYSSVGDSGSNPSGTWKTGSGVGADYEARATLDFGSLTSGTTGTWLSLGTSRTWTVTGNGGEVALMTMEIRDATTLVVYTAPYVELVVGF